MNADLSLCSPPSPSARNPSAALAALFWVVTYLLFSLRSELRFDGTSAFINGHRAVATFVGATAFWLLLAHFDRLTERSRRSPFLVAGAIVPASIAVLGAMALADLLWPAETLPFNRYLRWVMVWAGYFAAAVGFYVGHQIYRRVRACGPVALAGPVAAAAERAAASPACLDQPPSAEAIEWLVDSVAEEMAAAPALSREALVARLAEKAGYRLADDSLAPGHNARIDLVERLSARLNAPKADL